MTITNHPLHRSGRALLTHPAPALGDDAKSPERIRVMKRRQWQPKVKQTEHPFPRKAGFLAASPERRIPVSTNVKAKRRQRVLIRRHPVVPGCDLQPPTEATYQLRPLADAVVYEVPF